MSFDLVTGAVISWLVGRFGDSLTRVLAGDKQEKALRQVVRNAVEAAVGDLSAADHDAHVLSDALLLESPDTERTAIADGLALGTALDQQIRPKLAALEEQGYRYDVNLLFEAMGRRIQEGIQADAVRDGPLRPLAEYLRHEELIDVSDRHHRYDYTPTIREFAPEALLGREKELGELVEFCTSPGAGEYAYWTAEPWAGKTALLASFVLRGLPGVRFVSFFIRAIDHDDREAFLIAATRQFAAILGKQPPCPPTRPDFLDMLNAAAAVCRKRDQRLVLVVDGLDEDWHSAERSIAALLPARLPTGVRIVASGRPGPPIPIDVDYGHPLNDPAVRRELAPSPYAQVIRRDAERDVKRLLNGTEMERELLGLIVASDGGLGIQCLEELTGQEGWRIEECLSGVTGRVFRRRAAAGWSGTGVDGAYVLAHKDLHELAMGLLGKSLGRCRRRILVWAHGYRERCWPLATPEYLLDGYFRMLRGADEHGEMIACAVDDARHDRMLDMSCGEVISLEEVTATQAVVLAAESPDLPTMVLLGMHHAKLTWRNANIPHGLPVVWAVLGHLERAETLARSITSDRGQLMALAGLVGAFGKRGNRVRATALADEVVQRAATAPADMDPALIAVAGMVAEGGFPRRAEKLARNLASDASRRKALAAITGAWAAQGDFSRAVVVAQEVEELARSVLDGHRSANAARFLSSAVSAWAGAGEADRAQAIAQEIDDCIRDTTEAYEQGSILMHAAEAWAIAGNIDRTDELIRRLAQMDSSWLSGMAPYTVARVAGAWAAAGHLVHAEEVARGITDPDRDDQSKARIEALSAVVKGWAESGEIGGAYAIAQQVEELARSVSWPRDRADALTRAARAWTDAGISARGEALAREAAELARTVSDVPKVKLMAEPGAAPEAVAQARAEMDELVFYRDRPPAEDLLLRAAAAASARMGQPARVLAITRIISHPTSRDWALSAAERLAAWTRLTSVADRAQAILQAITGLGRSAWVVEDCAWGGGGGGDQEIDRSLEFLKTFIALTLDVWGLQAVAARGTAVGNGQAVAREAEEFAQLIQETTQTDDNRELLNKVDELCCRATPGLHDRAYALARSMLTPDDLAWGLAGAARAWAKKPYFFGTQDLLTENLFATLSAQLRAIAALAWTRAGDADRACAAARRAEQDARDVVSQVSSPATRTLLLAIAASAWAQAGSLDQARTLADEAEGIVKDMTDPHHQAWALGDAALAWLAAGDSEHGLDVAQRIEDPRRHGATLVRMAHTADTRHATLFLARALGLGPAGWFVEPTSSSGLSHRT
jgi:hypothetical protein